MQIDAKLPDSPSAWVFLNSGLDIGGLLELWDAVRVRESVNLPRTLKAHYFPADPPLPLDVEILAFNPTHVRLTIADATIAARVRDKLDHYSFENDGKAVFEREHQALWAKVEAILQRDELSYDKLRYEKAKLTPRAIDALIALCDSVDPRGQWSIYRLFDKSSVPKSEHKRVARWLVTLFERTRDPHHEVGIPLSELAGPELAADLLRLVNDPRAGNRRWTICNALARTKHPAAAEAIAGLLGQGVNTRGALETLAKLPAHAHIDAIRKCLRDPNPDVRRQAKKTLQKLGIVDDAPPPTHLIKGKKPPRALAEWSANLHLNEVGPTLQKLTRCIDAGFGKAEMVEVLSVAEQTPVEATRTFRFSITAGAVAGDLWIVIFMDDEDAPDLSIHADARIIATLNK